MKLSPEEQGASRIFASNPRMQGELREFIATQGAEFGRELTRAIERELSVDCLLSNSGCCAAAYIVSEQIKKQQLREVGHDDLGISIFTKAAIIAAE
jgi:hypothetical protein